MLINYIHILQYLNLDVYEIEVDPEKEQDNWIVFIAVFNSITDNDSTKTW